MLYPLSYGGGAAIVPCQGTEAAPPRDSPTLDIAR